MKTLQLVTLLAALVLWTGIGSLAFGGGSLPPEATGNVYVTGSGSHKVFCFGGDGAFRFDFTHEDLRAPRGLVFSEREELFVAAQNSDRILVFGTDGTYLRQFTGGGLDGPTSLAFAPDGKLYVSSFSTDEVLVFGDEEFERAITADGLNGPNCIAFDPSGNFYVASQLTSEVYRFEADGTPIDSFTGDGISSTMGIAIWRNRLFVTGGGSSAVGVFNLAGEQIDRLPTAPIRAPQGIAFDENGTFLTPSFADGTIARFSADGEHLGTFEDVGADRPRGAAGFPARRLQSR